MTIAVVIPAHNEAAFIGMVLASVIQQTRPPDEVVVVCDRCTDDTAVRVEEVFRRISSMTRCRAIPVDVGDIAGARNAGIRATTSDILVCLDADTLLHPAALSSVERAVADGVILGGFRMVSDDRYRRTFGQTLLNRLWIGSINLCAVALGNFVGTGCFFRRDIGLLYNEAWGWGEDIEFCGRVRRQVRGKIYCLQETPLVYCDRRFLERGYRRELFRRLRLGLDHLRREGISRIPARWRSRERTVCR